LRERGEPPCDIAEHHLRPRKTGPCYPLTVIKCETHEIAFTLYPPGFAPYQRQPIFQLAPEGRAVLHEETEESLPDFHGTLFQAALDAAQRQAWARNSDEEVPDSWWSTQGRHIQLALQFLGLLRTTTDQVRETIAAVLSVACLLLRDESPAIDAGYQGKGRAVTTVLEALAGRELLAIRLLFCGYVTGTWGRPWSWDPSRRCLETLPFPAVESTAPT
jgi:hypothetical protein